MTSEQFLYGDIKILGGSGNDVLWSSAGDDYIDGESGDDNIDGGVGNDQLFGGSGDDKIHGRGGNDSISGGERADIISTGAGLDSIDYSFLSDSTSTNRDTITDFEKGSDILNFEELAAHGIIDFGDISVTNDGSNTVIAANDSDFELQLSGVYELDEGDFVWG